MQLEPPRFSIVILLEMLAILAVSVTVYAFLVRRSTIGRRWLSLVEYARSNEMVFHNGDAPIPAPISELSSLRPTILVSLKDKHAQIVKFETITPERRHEWHVLIRPIQSHWPATALRPAHQQTNSIDLYSLSTPRNLHGTERFQILGRDENAARRLQSSSARALLPPDIGLLLHGGFLVLDFSSRPFDEIELGRTIALANQLAGHLPYLEA